MLPLTYTGGPLATNAYLIPNAEASAYICFDAPEGLAAEIRTSGLKIEALILTHGHHDHVWDAAAITRDHRCPVYLHPADFDRVQADNRYPRIDHITRLAMPHLGTVTGSTGGHKFRLFHIPGHSPGSIAIYEESEARIFVGDVIFAEGIGRTGDDEARRAELINGIRRHLLPLPDDTAIYPGHGPATTIGAERHNPAFGSAA